MATTITSIEKNGPVIICYTDDPKGRTYKINFETCKITSVSGSTLKSTNSFSSKIPVQLKDSIYYKAINALSGNLLSNTYKDNIKKVYSIIESFLSYPDLIDKNIDRKLINTLICEEGKIPKGFINWCKKNQTFITLDSYRKFYIAQIIAQWPQELIKKLEKINNGMSLNLIRYTQGNLEMCKLLTKLIDNSLKRYEISICSPVQYIISILLEHPDWFSLLNENQTVKIAKQILKNKADEEMINAVVNNEKKLLPLHETIINNFMIKIPLSNEDLIDEGKQQNNCVGYYYHRKIADGTYLIYFLRNPENPNKSYVTCRYDCRYNETVEARTKYNIWFDDNSDTFEKIDKMIQKLLTK